MSSPSPDGAYGHPVHIAISQLTAAAVMQAARRGHGVSKFYYFAETKAVGKAYLEIFGDLKSTLTGGLQILKWRSVPLARTRGQSDPPL